MKKVLLGTSALIAAGIIASPAAAQVEMAISGEIQFMAGVYAEDDSTEGDDSQHVRWGTDAQFQIDVSAVSDTGIYYGGRIDIEDDGGNLGTTDLNVDEAYIYLSGGFGTVTLGNDDGANDIAQNVPGAGTGILDGDAPGYFWQDPVVFWDAPDSGDAAKVYYRTSGAGGAPGVAALANNNIELGVSYAIDNSQNLDRGANEITGTAIQPDNTHVFEFGARWSPTFGSVTLTPSGAITYFAQSNDGRVDNAFTAQAGLNLGFGGFNVGVGYVYAGEGFEGDDSNHGVNLGANYTTGPWTFGAQYALGLDERLGAADTVSHSYGAGVTYAWLPGLNLEADVGAFHTQDGPTGDNDGVIGLTRVNLSF